VKTNKELADHQRRLTTYLGPYYKPEFDSYDAGNPMVFYDGTVIENWRLKEMADAGEIPIIHRPQ
jgi:hypothetical protein